MRLTNFLQFIGICTLVCLSYVHMQMTIIDMAYKGKAKEKQIRNLIEENGNVTYSILTLKSSSHLGHTLLTDETDMRFADAENIIRVNTDEIAEDIAFENELVTVQQAGNDGRRSIFSIVPFGRSAEAQTRK